MTTSLAYLPPEESRGEPLTTRSDIFCLGVLARHCLTGTPSPGASNGHLPPELVEVLDKATDDLPVNRYERADDLLRAIRRAAGTDVVTIAAAGQPSPQAAPPRNPYKGLRAFTETDAIDFHGRGALVDDLLRALASNRLVTVVGPSGSGKSSVVRAGLIPALRSGGLPGSRGWLFTDMFPGSYPFEELGAALLRVAVDNPPDLVDEIVADERGLLRVCKQILPTDDTDLVLIIDQFEEIFSSVAAEGTRRLFLDALTTVVADERSRIRLILTMRADFFDRPLEYPAFAEAMRTGIVTVSIPSEEGLAQAVSGPAKRVGVELEPGLVNHVLRDVKGQPGSLPLLQYALTEMFSQRQGNLLTVELYKSTGGVLGALGRRADEIYDSLSPVGQAAAEQLFLRLLTVDETAGTTRRRILQSELKSLAIDQVALDQALQQFGAFRLLSFDLHPVTRGPTVEVAHEALLTEWGTLRAWVDDRRNDLAIQRRINLASQEWTESERDASYLLRGARLDQAEQWVEESGIAVSSDESRYLAASAALRQDEKSAGRRRRFRMLGAVAAGLIVVGTLGGLALRQSNRALVGHLATESVVALDTDPELAILLALESAERAIAAGDEVPTETMAALHNAVQVSRVEGTEVGGYRQVDVWSAGKLVATDNRGSPRESSDKVTIRDLDTGKILRELRGPGEVIGLAWSPDGRLAVGYLTGPDQATLFYVIWDPITGQRLAGYPVTGEQDTDTTQLAWSPDDQFLAATSGSDDQVVVWNTRTDEELFLEGPATDVGFLDHRTLLVSSPEGEVVYYEIPSGTELQSMPTAFGPYRMAIDRSRARVVMADVVMTVGAWDLDTEAWLWDEPVPSPDRSDPPALAITEAGQGLVASTGNDGSIRLLDLETGLSQAVLAGHKGWVYDAALTDDGTRLASVGTDGTTRTWEATPSGPPSVNRPIPHPIPIELDVSPDGRTIAVQTQKDPSKDTDEARFDLIDIETGKPRTLWEQKIDINFPAILSTDFQNLASLGVDNVARVFDLSTFAEVKRLPRCLVPTSFNPAGDLLVLSRICPHEDPDQVVEGTSVVLDWATGAEKLPLVGIHWTSAFNPGGTFEAGRYLALATLQGGGETPPAVEIYDMQTSRLVMKSDSRHTISLAFDPSGRYLAGGDEITGIAWVLDMVAVTKGKSWADSLIFNRVADDEIVWRVALNSDGVLATTGPRTLRLWDVFQRKMIAEPYVARAFPPVSTFGPDGDYLLYGDVGIRTYHFEPEPLIELAHTRVTRELTPAECEQYLQSACDVAE